ncbi:helix-turn-helix transcriptional regulator [Microbacterium sp. VKM Ac-2923]|uniref:helix-turn-helix domain-containing protein n=1 Tax=Microbacterium sp. VKM Ac-2923 TaxID=2929476 RepID=UPI001FB351E9|nr:helix-turn-helix transcriptional regulator [Microbacterium sp. VKM Ac-2923]MCJ1709287.1 helix-turn-helix domain-containing protein [Microbacterium sp. VKM Ac-2923]
MNERERRTNFGQQIRLAMDAKGFSQSELARRMRAIGWAGYSQMTVSRILNYERSVPVEEWDDLARVLDISGVEISTDERLELQHLRGLVRSLEESLAHPILHRYRSTPTSHR